MKISSAARNAVFIGFLCACSYLAVYFARNILSPVTPQMLDGGFDETTIAALSSAYFMTYAVGQLINGGIGDRINARWMVSVGLVLAGLCNFLVGFFADIPVILTVAYAASGFFLSMIYGPMTKVIAENNPPLYATRCSLGYTFASFLGTPLAGVAAAALPWRRVFSSGGIILVVMGALCFIAFLLLEKNGIVRYRPRDLQKERGGDIRILLKRQIVKFTLVSNLTGIIRTSVVFWLPTFIHQYLGYSEDLAASVFTVATFAIAATPFISIMLYERLGYHMERTMKIGFSLSVLSFLLVFFVKVPALNILFMVLAIMTANFSSTMLWSVYCPSLKDTGMVSFSTGFIDVVSYMAAATANILFANAVGSIGWGNLILVWAGLSLCGLAVSFMGKRIIIVNNANKNS